MQNIDILLATYNSSRYISAQIDSILNQTCSSWRLIIRDDNSSDNTCAIIEEYIRKFPEKILFIKSDVNYGIKHNFSELMKVSTAPYIMFSDHDDVWHSNKVENTLCRMIECEDKWSNSHPLLIFTDKSVVDHNLNILFKSHADYERFECQNLQLNKLLVQNVVSGCTMMINNALKELCIGIPNEAIMHDYWIAIIAAVFGDISYINEATMMYRQHCSNSVGIHKRQSFAGLVRRFLEMPEFKARYGTNIRQCKAFIATYNNRIDADHLKVLNSFALLETSSWLNRCHIILKNRFFKKGFVSKLSMLFSI